MDNICPVHGVLETRMATRKQKILLFVDQYPPPL
jgi:hypothetical protein